MPGKTKSQRAAFGRAKKQFRSVETGQFVEPDEQVVDLDAVDDLLVDGDGNEITVAAYYEMANELSSTDAEEEGQHEDDENLVIAEESWAFANSDFC